MRQDDFLRNIGYLVNKGDTVEDKKQNEIFEQTFLFLLGKFKERKVLKSLLSSLERLEKSLQK